MITDDVLIQAYDSGLSLQAIADSCGSTFRAIKRRASSLGIAVRGPGGHRQERDEVIEQLLRTGQHTYREIAAQAGCSDWVVARVARKMGW